VSDQCHCTPDIHTLIDPDNHHTPQSGPQIGRTADTDVVVIHTHKWMMFGEIRRLSATVKGSVRVRACATRTCTHTHTDTITQRERERERERCTHPCTHTHTDTDLSISLSEREARAFSHCGPLSQHGVSAETLKSFEASQRTQYHSTPLAPVCVSLCTYLFSTVTLDVRAKFNAHICSYCSIPCRGQAITCIRSPRGCVCQCVYIHTCFAQHEMSLSYVGS